MNRILNTEIEEVKDAKLKELENIKNQAIDVILDKIIKNNWEFVSGDYVSDTEYNCVIKFIETELSISAFNLELRFVLNNKALTVPMYVGSSEKMIKMHNLVVDSILKDKEIQRLAENQRKLKEAITKFDYLISDANYFIENVPNL